MHLETAEVPSPIGTLGLVVRGKRLCRLEFSNRCSRIRGALERRFGPVSLEERPDPAGVASRLRAYLAGDLGALEAIPVDTGGTAFQQEVWTALREVGPGTTVAYADLARAIGRPRAVRAVGAANGANPVPLVVPCHRVIGADGSLTGYGGGLRRKKWLLRHERATFRPEPTRGREQVALPFATLR